MYKFLSTQVLEDYQSEHTRPIIAQLVNEVIPYRSHLSFLKAAAARQVFIGGNRTFTQVSLHDGSREDAAQHTEIQR